MDNDPTFSILAPFRFQTLKTGPYPYVSTTALKIRYLADWTNIPGEYTFIHQGNVLGTLFDRTITIFPGYAIDGATCAPDYPDYIAQFFLHDFLYQFLRTAGAPWTRKEADQAMLDCGRYEAFPHRRTFYTAVRLCGWIFSLRYRQGTYIKWTPKTIPLKLKHPLKTIPTQTSTQETNKPTSNSPTSDQ